MEFYLILGNTKAMVFNWEGGVLRLNGKGKKNTVYSGPEREQPLRITIATEC